MVIDTIDINCDLGEGTGNDELIMPLIDSCSIACGGHFGNTQTMTAAVRLAKKYQVKCGAHPSFPDPEHFGRKEMDISSIELINSIRQQIISFKTVCDQEDMKLNHIKLHGALYNLAAKDIGLAQTVLAGITLSRVNVPIYVPFQSVISQLARGHFKTTLEAFGDRRYEENLSLVSRAKNNAIITDKKEAWAQIQSIITSKQVETVTGQWVDIQANTFCIHGDQKNAVEMLTFIREQLDQLK